MKLYKDKKGIKTLVTDLQQKDYNNLRFEFNPFDRRMYGYSVELSPHELLSTAKAALVRLEKLAGIEYKVFVRVVKDDSWHSI